MKQNLQNSQPVKIQWDEHSSQNLKVSGKLSQLSQNLLLFHTKSALAVDLFFIT